MLMDTFSEISYTLAGATLSGLSPGSVPSLSGLSANNLGSVISTLNALTTCDGNDLVANTGAILDGLPAALRDLIRPAALAPVVSVVAPIVSSVVSAIAPVLTALRPIVTPIASAAAPVLTPLATAIPVLTPIVAPLAGPSGSSFFSLLRMRIFPDPLSLQVLGWSELLDSVCRARHC